MALDKKLVRKINWNTFDKLPNDRKVFWGNWFDKMRLPDSLDYEEEKSKEAWLFIAGIGIAIVSGMMINSLYELFRPPIDLNYLTHLFIVDLCFGAIIFFIYKLRKEIRERELYPNLERKHMNDLTYSLLKRDGLLKDSNPTKH